MADSKIEITEDEKILKEPQDTGDGKPFGVKFRNLVKPDYAIALFILYLILAGNFAGDLFGCRLQEAFTELAFVKHIIAIFLLYYFVNLTTPGYQDPLKILIKTIIMYFVFIISRNVSFGYILIFIILMIVVKFIDDYKKFHYKADKDDEVDTAAIKKENFDRLEKIQQNLVIIIYIVIFIGFIRYSQSHFTSDLSWSSYLFGKNRFKGCKSLTDKYTLKGVYWF